MRRIHGKLRFAKRVASDVRADNVQIVAAGIAFYFFLSLFPAIAACLAIYGLALSPSDAASQVEPLRALVPGQAYRLVHDFVSQLSAGGGSALGWGAALSIFLSIWSTNKGTAALFTGLNIAYNVTDDRPFIRRTLLTLAFTVGALVVIILLLAVVAVLPAIRAAFSLPPVFDALIRFARWPLIVVVALIVLGTLYHLAPNRRHSGWRWVTPGSLIATSLWLLGSLGFGWYIDSFGNMSKTYGSVAAIAVLMLWFFITAFAILLGAEIDARSAKDRMREEAEHPPAGG